MFKITSNTTFALFMATGLLASMSSSVMAETQWQKDHPRRHQVNERLHNQNKRIHQEVKKGEITKAQAASLHKQDHQVRKEEQIMASQNNGHITKQEQNVLNKQENAVSKEIGK